MTPIVLLILHHYSYIQLKSEIMSITAIIILIIHVRISVIIKKLLLIIN